jgi:hypothetical protein
LTATLSSPLSRLEGHGPHQLETPLRWDPAPELAVERAVVGVEAHHSGRSLATLVTALAPRASGRDRPKRTARPERERDECYRGEVRVLAQGAQPVAEVAAEAAKVARLPITLP